MKGVLADSDSGAGALLSGAKKERDIVGEFLSADVREKEGKGRDLHLRQATSVSR